MAPEMVQGGPIDHRVDIYELGIVLFHMLSGHVPFTGDSPLALAVKHLQEPLPRLHDTNPSIPSAVEFRNTQGYRQKTRRSFHVSARFSKRLPLRYHYVQCSADVCGATFAVRNKFHTRAACF